MKARRRRGRVFVVFRRASRRERAARLLASARQHDKRARFYRLSIKFHLHAARHARERERERVRWAREDRRDARRVMREPTRGRR